MFSETYGLIRKRGDDYWKYEWDAPFGLNINDKLIFWLGDLDSMDSLSQCILKPFNIESDHQLTRSEFYDAQMNCIFSDLIAEKQIIENKNKLFQNIKLNFGIDLAHLEDEASNYKDRVQRPIPITANSIESVINSLHKILIESVNIQAFKTFYESICKSPHKGYSGWKSIKYYQFLVEHFVKTKSNDIVVHALISPLYILNDLRILFDHLVSGKKSEQLKQNVSSSLGIEYFDDTEKLYLTLIGKLNSLFQLLVLYVN